MKLANFNEWLTLTANIGVLIGIFFLAYEIRQSTEAQLAVSRQGMLEADLEILTSVIDHPQIFINYRAEELSQEEQARQNSYWIAMTRVREYAWFQYQSGQMDERTWQSYLRPLIQMLNRDLARKNWEQSNNMDPEFRAYVNSVLNEN